MIIDVDVLEESQKLPGGIHIGHYELVYFRVYDCFLCDINRIPSIYKLYDTRVLILPFTLRGAPIYYRKYNPDTRTVEIYNYENSNSRFT